MMIEVAPAHPDGGEPAAGAPEAFAAMLRGGSGAEAAISEASRRPKGQPLQRRRRQVNHLLASAALAAEWPRERAERILSEMEREGQKALGEAEVVEIGRRHG